MGCCCKEKIDEDMTGEEYMEKNRRCTDVLFTLIFLAFWVGMVYAGAYGFSKGDPRILVYGTDYQGNLCGKGALEDFKVRYFVNPYEVLEAGNTAGANIKDAKSICLKACPAASSTLSWVCNYPDSLDSRGLNAITSTTTSYDQWAAMNYDYYSSITTGSHQANSRVYKGPCYPVLLPTTESYGTCSYYAKQTSGAKTAFASLLSTNSQSTPESYDLDDKVTALSDAVAEMLSTPASVMERYIEDFAKAWVVCLVCGFFAPVVLSFVWLGIMRYLAGFFAYFVIAFVNIFAILCTLWLYMKAGVIGNDAIAASDEDGGSSYTDPSEDNQEVLTYAAYACTALTVILLLFTLLMLKRVRIAVAVIKVATQCIAAAPMTIVFPLIPVFVALALFAYWVAAAVYMYSAGDIEQQSCTLTAGAQPQRYCADSADAKNCHCGYETKMTKDLQYMLLYHLFGLLWTTQWLQALTYLTIAYVFALFYFRGGSFSEGMRGRCSSPVFQSFKKMTWFHNGSACFGSLLVAILQFIRIIVAYVVHKMKKAGNDSCCIKYAACCLQYCLWYLQKVLEWINKNAYILIAIEGKSFCFSAWEAISLIMSNILTVGAVNIVGDVLLFLGKLGVALTSGFFAFMYLDTDEYTEGDNRVSSPLLIVVFVIIFAFILAGLFMSVVEMGIDATLLSFCKDCKIHGGKPKFAPPLLAEVLGKYESKQKARNAANRQ